MYMGRLIAEDDHNRSGATIVHMRIAIYHQAMAFLFCEIAPNKKALIATGESARSLIQDRDAMRPIVKWWVVPQLMPIGRAVRINCGAQP